MKIGNFLIISILGIATSLVAGVDSIGVSQTEQINNQAVTRSGIRVNWRKLRVGMSHRDVYGLLGEPMRVDVMSALTFWSYESFGSVRFDTGGLVVGWSEPY
jgi:outer membrane protein assembly factor BamE (lipoprotein component of BamABCDE complex)